MATNQNTADAAPPPGPSGGPGVGRFFVAVLPLLGQEVDDDMLQMFELVAKPMVENQISSFLTFDLRMLESFVVRFVL